MAGVVDFARLGGVIPKTVTREPRAGNPPPRTVETPSGMLNAIGLDNDGIDHFISHHLPYLRTLPTAIIANIAGKTEQEFVDMAEMMGRESGLAGLELNLSCPNVSGGVDFAVDPEITRRVVQRVARFVRCRYSPNSRRTSRTLCPSPRRRPTAARTLYRWSIPSSAWRWTGNGAGRSSVTSRGV